MTTISKQMTTLGIAFYTLAFALATLPFTRLFMLPCALLLLLLLFVDWNWKEKLQVICDQKLVLAFVAVFGIILVTMLGTIYTANPHKAFADWDCKVWFGVAALCVLPLSGRFSGAQVRTLLLVFCFSVLAVSIANMVWSCVLFLKTGSIDRFFYYHASHFGGVRPTHTSYQSMYCMVAWCVSVFFLLKKMFSQRWMNVLLWVELLLLPLEIVLLESKAGILVLIATVLLTAVYAINYRKRRIGLTLCALASLALLVAAGVWVGSKDISFTGRLTNSVKELRSADSSNPSKSTQQRVAVWKTASELAVRELPLGTGTGSANDHLCAAYRQKGYTHILQRQYNCHNQYLQSLLSQGVIGISSLLFFLGFCGYYAFRKRNFLLGMFTLIISLNMLVESMLEARAGSNFIPLMAVLLILLASENSPSEQNDTLRSQSK